MSCPDWNELIRQRDDGADGERRWLEALEHLDDCGSCHEAALAVEPTLMFRRLPAPEIDVTEMQQAVAALRRDQGRRDRQQKNGRRWRRLAIAAQVAVLVGAGFVVRHLGMDTQGVTPGVDVAGLNAPVTSETARPSATGPSAAGPSVVVIDGSPVAAGEDLHFDIRVLQADDASPGDELPADIAETLRGALRYDDYRVLAEASGTTRQGENVSYKLGGRFEVSFKLAEAGDQLKLDGFRVTRQSADKSRRLPPREIFNATVDLQMDEPLIVLTDREEPLVIAITCRPVQEVAPSLNDR